MMSDVVGISAASVHRIWKAHGLTPHRFRTFKLSNDVNFASKLRDVVGLYVDPPAHAIVLSVDEKSQIQALDRTQPGLPMKPGRCGTLTHDYKRNGTTTLFAALNVLDGSVIAAACNAIDIRNSSAFSTQSKPKCRPARSSTSSSTTTPRTNIPRYENGWRVIPRWTFHSCRRRAPG